MAPQDCINETAQLLASGILNTVTDFCIILLPIPIILQLKLPRRQQIILILVFSGGIVVCIAGVVRTYYTYQMTTGYDKTWSGYEVILSGSIEMYIIIVSVFYIGPSTHKRLTHALQRSAPLSRLSNRSCRATSLSLSGFTRPKALFSEIKPKSCRGWN